MTVASLRTPAVLIDRARALRNIERMQAAAAARGIALRPHAKTHKSPLVARWQLDRGAIGICCAKLGEAEALAAEGIDDILITSPVVSAPAIARSEVWTSTVSPAATPSSSRPRAIRAAVTGPLMAAPS